MKKFMTIIHAKNQTSTLSFAELLYIKAAGKNKGIKLFNKLPNTMKRIEILQEFKIQLHYFPMQHIFCSVDEYISV
jgi:hypothetical protein